MLFYERIDKKDKHPLITEEILPIEFKKTIEFDNTNVWTDKLRLDPNYFSFLLKTFSEFVKSDKTIFTSMHGIKLSLF